MSVISGWGRTRGVQSPREKKARDGDIFLQRAGWKVKEVHARVCFLHSAFCFLLSFSLSRSINSFFGTFPVLSTSRHALH